MPKREVRTLSGAQLRAKDADSLGASGYASIFNEVADLGWFNEVIMPGAFARALREKQDVRCLINHDSNLILGRTKAGTLRLHEDNKGLAMDCDFPATQVATDLHTLLKRGDIDQMSFGFTVTKQSWTEETVDKQTIQTRFIEDVDLMDVSMAII